MKDGQSSTSWACRERTDVQKWDEAQATESRETALCGTRGDGEKTRGSGLCWRSPAFWPYLLPQPQQLLLS